MPGAVIGISLVLVYNFTYHLTESVWGLVLAMTVGTFPLMLTPIVVALKDLPLVFEEAAECLGATRWQTYWRVVFPLIGPGVSAGLMLAFIIVFNEYLVTLFVHPVGITTAPLRIFNLVRTAGLASDGSCLHPTASLSSEPEPLAARGFRRPLPQRVPRLASRPLTAPTGRHLS